MSDDRQVVVIGSGPTGAIAATALVRCGIPVTMLEAGTAPPAGVLVRAFGKNILRRVPPLAQGENYIATGDPDTRWYVNLQLGGLTNQWTGAVPRFAPEDFDDGARLDERYRWPITYADLAPYYDEAERLLAITAGPGDVPNLPAGYADYRRDVPRDWAELRRVAGRHGQGFTTLPLADGPANLAAARGTAFNSFHTIVRGLVGRTGFRLITGAHAVRLEWSPGSRRVEGVLYQDVASGATARIEARAVVVAAGALNTTKLLFASACRDFPNGMGNENGVLGCYLHDHPREWWVVDVERPVSLLSPSAYLTRPPFASSAPLVGASWTLGVVTTGDRIRSRFGGKGTAIGVQVFGTMTPTEEHYARPLGKGTDELGMSPLEIRIRFDEAAVCNMLNARSRLLSLMEEAGMRATMRAVEPQLYPGSSVHYGGTARMHSDRRYGVVDGWNRMYDAPNVVVCDSSCFTTGPEKNPTLTAMAIAMRAGDRLADDLRHT